ncbi:MAG: hypothetical protein QOF56_1718 [Acidobacteriaceae bacterium]|jgi:hypothetical protein|nr:hypothetical protein [Acidobacteriaceae bacterium]
MGWGSFRPGVNFVRLSGWVEWHPKHDSGFNG